MTHGILENDTMFSVKERPWHGLGTVLEEAPTIEEGLKVAGLDWEVKMNAISTKVGGQHIRIPGKKATVKSNDSTVLGVVGENYKPLQNTEAFKFFEPFLDNGLATLETAGSLFNGKKVFVLAKMAGDALQVTENEGDEIENFILLSNAHDGSMAVRVGFTPVRVVCNNTLTFAHENEASKLIRVRHTGDVVQSLQEVRETMDLINKQFMATVEQYRMLSNKKDIVKSDVEKYVRQVFSTESLNNIILNYNKELEEKEEIEATRKRLINRVEEIFEMEPVQSAWTLYNSVNYYLNHDRGTLENRYNSLWYGNSKKIDKRAFEIALNCY